VISIKKQDFPYYPAKLGPLNGIAVFYVRRPTRYPIWSINVQNGVRFQLRDLVHKVVVMVKGNRGAIIVDEIGEDLTTDCFLGFIVKLHEIVLDCVSRVRMLPTKFLECFPNAIVGRTG
jgi:hypothetical protein